ncbi:MAG: hypothetical protein LC803_19100 [Acidobacteria bacterium]|nr:hypothetical protein [Acidobacteriota bacterium]
MSSEFNPYIKREPGDLVNAGDWNNMQVEIKKDISDKIRQAVDDIESVPHAQDSDKLGNKSVHELSEEIVNMALQQIAKRTGYLLLFKRLEPGETNIVEHNLKTFPLVQVFILDRFPIVYTEDNDERVAGEAYFFLYNRKAEQRLRATAGGASVEIERSSSGDAQFGIAWSELLALYGIRPDPRWSLANLENEFWSALFKDPNDRFDDDDYSHSPWFSRCCGEGRKISQVESSGDWDDIYLKIVARKTINTFSSPPETAPDDIEVVHYNFDKLGLTYQSGGGNAARISERRVFDGTIEKSASNEAARVMVLLKV